MVKSSSFVNEVLSFYLIKQLSKRLLDALTAVHYYRRRRKELVAVFKRAWKIYTIAQIFVQIGEQLSRRCVEHIFPHLIER